MRRWIMVLRGNQATSERVRPAAMMAALAWAIALGAALGQETAPPAAPVDAAGQPADDPVATEQPADPAATEQPAADPAAAEPPVDPATAEDTAAAPEEPAAESVDEAPLSAEGLPPGFSPPGEIPPEMDIAQELLQPGEEDELLKKLRLAGFDSTLRRGVLDANSRGIIEDWTRYAIHRMTLHSHHRELKKLREDAMRRIHTAGTLQTNATLQRQFREELLRQVVQKTEPLLKGQFHVRLNAAMLLSDLNIVEGDTTREIPPEAFAPAAEPLLQVLEDDTQPRAVKLVAANGLMRIALYATLNPNLNIRIGNASIKELGNKQSHYWYQMRLVQLLGTIDQTLDLQRKPFIVQALVEVMGDKQRHWVVRCEAARSLGRAKLDPQVNVSLVAYEIVRLTRQAYEAYQESPDAFYWQQGFFSIYLAFKPLNRVEESRQDGLMQKVLSPSFRASQTLVASAYNEILPFVRRVLDPNAAEPGVERLDNWLQQNQAAGPQASVR